MGLQHLADFNSLHDQEKILDGVGEQSGSAKWRFLYREFLGLLAMLHLHG